MKVTLLTMILYNLENSIRDLNHFSVHCFVTEVLFSNLHLSCSSETVMNLDYQILLKTPPPPLNFTGWIQPCFTHYITWLAHAFVHSIHTESFNMSFH